METGSFSETKTIQVSLGVMWIIYVGIVSLATTLADRLTTLVL